MSKVNFIRTNGAMVVTYDGKLFTIAESDSRFNQVKLALAEGRESDIPGIVEIERHFEGTGLQLRDGVLFDGETALPSQLNARILAYRDEGLPFQPLVNFWENIKKNPSYNSRQMLFKFLEHNGHPLTEDGHFIAYRGVNNEFKDMHTGTMDNSPGKVVEMPRDLVDDNPNNTCSNGLHVACFEYAKGFGPKLVEVKVNPSDVVAVPTDYNGTKMRVSKFEVIQEISTMRTEQLYGYTTASDISEMEDSDEDDIIEQSEEDENRQALENGECPDCGSDVDPTANFCSECGVDLDQFRN
jgi:hypothetical protein